MASLDSPVPLALRGGTELSPRGRPKPRGETRVDDIRIFELGVSGEDLVGSSFDLRLPGFLNVRLRRIVQAGEDFVSKLRAGVVWANTFNKFDPTSPFGGFKESGFGREGGLHGLLPYLSLG